MEVDLAEARKTFDTNFFAVIAMCQTFVPLLIKAKGTIVQLGSIAAVRASTPLANWKVSGKRSLLTSDR